MILSTAAAATKHIDMGPIFTIFFAFWAVVLVVLWIGTGLLVRKQDQLVERARKSQLHHH
jgi:hypothetical protein